jgi:glycosyltransferase involved in cell wall biosynthesis
MASSNTPTRVAMVSGSSDATRDGVADYVSHLVPALAEVGVQVQPIELSSLASARRQVHRSAPDLVHVQFAPSAYGFSLRPGWLPLLLGRRAPLVTTVHEYGWWRPHGWLPDPLWRLAERHRWWDRETGRLVPGSAAVVVTNDGHAETVRARFAEPVADVIPLAPNVSGQHAVRRTGGGGPVLAFFGYVHPVKGVRYLIEAVATLRARHPGVRLVVVGGFTSLALPEREAARFREELLAIARRCGVADRVEFTGYLPSERVTELLSTADIGVLPFTEGVTAKSGALLTLFSHRLPTVVTAPAEPDPALADGRQVRAVHRRRDGTALAEAIDSVLTDPALRERLAAEGARIARDRTWSRVADDHRALYERVLSGSQVRAPHRPRRGPVPPARTR